MEIELWVENEEFRKIRERKREVQKNFERIEELEETLEVLQMKMLLEKKRRLEKKIEEIKRYYEGLIEFSERAKRDRELLKQMRKAISEENRKFRKELQARRNEDNCET